MPPGASLASARLLDVLGELPSIVIGTDLVGSGHVWYGHVGSGYGILADGHLLLARLSRLSRPWHPAANRVAAPLVPTRHVLVDRQYHRVADLTRPGRLATTDGYQVTGAERQPFGSVRRTRPATGQIRILLGTGRTLRLQGDGPVAKGLFKVVDEQDDQRTVLAGVRRHQDSHQGSYRVTFHAPLSTTERLLIAVGVICLDQARPRWEDGAR